MKYRKLDRDAEMRAIRMNQAAEAEESAYRHEWEAKRLAIIAAEKPDASEAAAQVATKAKNLRQLAVLAAKKAKLQPAAAKDIRMLVLDGTERMSGIIANVEAAHAQAAIAVEDAQAEYDASDDLEERVALRDQLDTHEFSVRVFEKLHDALGAEFDTMAAEKAAKEAKRSKEKQAPKAKNTPKKERKLKAVK